MPEYTKDELAALHKINMDMAKYFVDFCNENGLMCYFCGGGCIGAVRHKGFIPWDDDIDVLMPRPDYEKLMYWRLGILKEHGLGLNEIQNVIATIDPLPGAREFMDKLRATTQVVIVSDTFQEFAQPLMKKLGWPTILCNSLVVAPDGEIKDFTMRCDHSKLTTVRALQSIGFDTIAAGDSYNDLDMILNSHAGFLFRSTQKIKDDHPQLAAYEEYDDLLAAIRRAQV